MINNTHLLQLTTDDMPSKHLAEVEPYDLWGYYSYTLKTL